MTTAPVHISLPVRDQSLRLAWRRGVRNTFAVASAFVLIVAGIMLAAVLRDRSDDLLKAPKVEALKTQLAADSSNEELKATIRKEDEDARNRWFQRRAFLLQGGWLLLGGAIVLATSAKVSSKLGATTYLPVGPAPVDHGLVPALKLSLAIGAGLTAALLLAMRLPAFRGISFSLALNDLTQASGPDSGAPVASVGSHSADANTTQQKPIANPANPSAKPDPTQTANILSPIVAPSPLRPAPLGADPQKNWFNFRGPGNLGVVDGEYPTQWDAATGQNIAWHTAVPLPGHGSPIVAGDRVFLTGGSDQKREAYCFDAKTGALKWTRQVGKEGPYGVDQPNADTGWAPSTPASDGSHFFAIFPTGELACFDLEGQPIWSKNLDLRKNTYGHASSLLTYGGLLFLQLDLGTERDKLSSLLALDCASGKQVWKVSQPVGGSWSTPSIIPTASGPQLITMADPWVISYQPQTGAELWRAKGLSGEIVASPAFSDGILYIATDQGGLLAIHPDGHGDVTKSKLKRTDPDTLPDIVSPLAIGNRVLLVGSSGTLCWFDPVGEKAVWSQEFQIGYQSSPVAVGPNHIYLTDRQGATHIIHAADAFTSMAISPIGQEVRATPAFHNGRIYIRGAKELFCVAEKAATSSRENPASASSPAQLRSVSYSLTPVLGGEGWGEGPGAKILWNSELSRRSAPHPTLSPEYEGEGKKSLPASNAIAPALSRSTGRGSEEITSARLNASICAPEAQP